MRVTIKIVLDTRHIKQSGLYPVKIRVTFQRTQKYYPVQVKSKAGKFEPCDLSPDDFARVYGEKPREPFKSLREYLESLERKAHEAVEESKSFSFQSFEAAMFYKKPSNTSSDLAALFDAKIKELADDGKISSKLLYENSLKSFLGFKPGLKIFDINHAFLRSYLMHMDNTEKSRATAGLYLRNLRHIFNEAMDAGIVTSDLYPFKKGKGKKGFQIPSKSNKVEPLRQAEISKVFRYKPKNESESRARDLWLFAFLMNGANMKDVSLLKFKDIDSHGRITFYRAKTKNTAIEQKSIEVPLLPAMKSIIDRWGNDPGKPDEYVFPILKKGMTATQQHQANENIRKYVRKYMARIAKSLGIEKTNIHNYTARDSYAAAQRAANESVDTIGEALGHENRGTTDTYIDKFGKDTQDRLAGNAMRFIDDSEPDSKK